MYLTKVLVSLIAQQDMLFLHPKLFALKILVMLTAQLAILSLKNALLVLHLIIYIKVLVLQSALLLHPSQVVSAKILLQP